MNTPITNTPIINTPITNTPITNTSSYLHIFTDKVCNNIIPQNEIAYEFPYTLDAFQQEGIYRIHKNENILITAHTGSGKTVLAIYAIAHCLKNNQKIIYTSPTKSLSNQKYSEFTQKFPHSIGIMTGDLKMNPDAQCIIMTTEILRNILYNTNNNNHIDIHTVGTIIFDEIHYINDPDRGKVWEECIVLLPKHINLVMLSATIDKPEIFASWIGNIKEKPIHLIPTSHRVVPLKHYFWKSFPFIDNKGKDNIYFKLVEIMDNHNHFQNYDFLKKNYTSFDINKIMDTLVDFLIEQNHLPSLFFILSRKKCENFCKMVRKNLLTFDEISSVEKTFDHYMKDYKKIYEILPQYHDVLHQLKKGVVYHHSGLIPILKEIIEILYSQGLIKILFATETFSIGVNMPTKTVLFSQLEKFDNHGSRLLRTDEYLQMCGRAGRRGIDTFGSVILLPTMELPDYIQFKNMLSGNSPCLESKFTLSYQFVLKTLYSSDFNMNEFLSKTFISNEFNTKILSLLKQKNDLQINSNNITFSNNELELIKEYNTIYSKLNDTFFSLKKKDRIKFENQIKNIQNIPNFTSLHKKYTEFNTLQKELDNIDYNIHWYNSSLKNNIQIIIQILENNSYILNHTISIKGIIAMNINECNEILLTEIIYRGFFDNLDFPSIVSILSSLLNEKEPSKQQEKYISDLNIDLHIKNILHNIQNISQEFIQIEEKNKLYINNNYNLYLDYVETTYTWANGGLIQDIYKINQNKIDDGNFVKIIMRINNLCENLYDICKNIQRFDICSIIENYNTILIRDITSINSLYL
jgi:superfamily II RNA helicase